MKHNFSLKCLLSKLNTSEISKQTWDGLAVIGTAVQNIKYITPGAFDSLYVPFNILGCSAHWKCLVATKMSDEWMWVVAESKICSKCIFILRLCKPHSGWTASICTYFAERWSDSRLCFFLCVSAKRENIPSLVMSKLQVCLICFYLFQSFPWLLNNKGSLPVSPPGFLLYC